MSEPLGFTLTERERFVDDLLGYMTLEEKIGQLVLLPAESLDREDLRERLRKGRVSAISGIADWHESEALQQIAVEQSRLGIPLLFAADTSRGWDTVMPVPLAAAASWDPEAIERSERATAAEASAAGVSWALAPALRLSDARDPEALPASCGSEPFLAVQAAIARIRGLQGASLRDPASMLACLDLHPAGLQRAGDSAALLEIFLAAVRETQVGSAVHGIEELTAPLVRQLGALDLLRGQWGFSGVLLAEWSAIATAALRAETPAPYTDLPVDAVLAAVNSGRMPQDRIDAAVRRVLAAKFNLGLFREPYRTSAETATERPKPREAALDLARKSIVLLRNDPAILPLPPHGDGLLVVGTAASDRVLPLAGREGKAMSVIDGLEQLGIRHRYAPGLALRDGERGTGALIEADRIAIGMAVEATRRADRVVLVLGEGIPEARHGTLGEAHRVLLDAVANLAEKLIVVTLGSRPLALGPSVGAILHAGGLGTMSGVAIAEVLSGKTPPSGRLACAYGGPAGQTYPFGYGLGYGDTIATGFSLELGADRIVASIDVSNAGELDGDETLQLYIRRCDVAAASPEARLKGFTKVRLAPGEARRVTFELGAVELGGYDREGRFILPHGRYEILVGTSTATVRGGEIALPAAVAEAMAGRGLAGYGERRSA